MKTITSYFQEEIVKVASSSIYKKITQWYLNTFKASKDEFYSYDEPTDKQMEGKTFWIQIYTNNEEEN
ncbi:MAG: hypothetical protein J6W64_02410 [Bacilli bacterium]|nr:hypothetical protein [Bacilli bacterium]